MIHCAATRMGPSDCGSVGGESWVHSAHRDMFRGMVPSAWSDHLVSVAQHSVGGCWDLMGPHLRREDGMIPKVAEAEHKPNRPDTTIETRQRFQTVGGDHAALV
jgi:hypothetical protein